MKDFSLILKGNRIDLRILEPTFENAKTIFNAIDENRDHLLPWMEWASTTITKTAEDSFRFLEMISKELKEKTKYDYSIFVGGEYLGQIGFFNIIESSKSAEIGYWIKKSESKKGYISEALAVIENEVFSQNGLNRLVIKCDTRNKNSANVAKKNGYVLEGTFRQDRYNSIENIVADTYVFSKLKEI